MTPRRDLLAFAATLAAIVAFFFAETLFGGKVLSPADVLRVAASFREGSGPASMSTYEPANRLLMDPVLQFQPWLEFNRSMIRRGRLPLWNDHAGCGAPHLANGQSAVFDPIHAIAYLGRLPEAHAWMAAVRLWLAGLGMFLLARRWGLGGWGRWFSGLAFPFCGFLVVWLLYPVTGVAVWMPWLFLATDRVLETPSLPAVGGLGLAVALVLLGGHVQTSAHVLLAAGLYALWLVRSSAGAWWRRASRHVVLPATWRRDAPARLAGAGQVDPERQVRLRRWGLPAWALGTALGLAVAAVEVVPLGAYLARSPVWGDREREKPSPWSLTRPRLLGAVCTALPYAFGSQRRGHPHLGRALGVHNLNESAGGFAGLATLVWLAPLGWSTRRTAPRAWFLAGLTGFGAMAAFGVAPVDNVLRALPVLGVTDNRRLTLWVAFGLILLGGIGLDSVSRPGRRPAVWAWLAVAVVLLAASVAVGYFEPLLQRRAVAHYAAAAAATPGAEASVYLARARHQVELTIAFVPRYFGLAAAQLLVLSALAWLSGRGRVTSRLLCPALVGLTMIDLLGFGRGLNPAIVRSEDRPETAVLNYLRREVPPPGRILGLGEELIPNTLMRYGLNDLRNYDSVELARSLRWFAPLYEAGPRGLTSRREVGWEGVIRARERLIESSVEAVVGPVPPPPGVFERVDRVGAVWVARLGAAPWAELDASPGRIKAARESGRIMVECELDEPRSLIIRETCDAGWCAELDGRPVPVGRHRGVFLAVAVPAGRHRLALRYDPPEVRTAVWTSCLGLCAVVFALTGPALFRSTRIIADGLGRTQAAELKSVLCSSPAKH